MDDLTYPQWYSQDVGLAVFPLRGKVPYPGSRGCLEATTDLATIRQWEGYYGECNWGVATGEASGVFVVDVDDEASWLRLMDMYRATGDPWMSATPSGGTHLWYAYPAEGVRNSAGQVAAGVDVRGDGGYVVAPPSTLPNGAYTWDALLCPERLPWPSPAPEWLLRLIWQKRGAPMGVRPAPSELREGRRNTDLASLAGFFRRKGLTADEIFPSLQAINLKRGRPPLDEQEVWKVARSMERYDPAPTLRVGGA